MNRNFKSITMRTVAIVMPLLIIIMVLINMFTYFHSKDALKEQTEERMNNQLESVGESIEKSLLANSKIPELVARQIELSPTSLSLSTFENTLINSIPTYDSTYGGGIFFEPYKYKKDIEYFSTFAYRDNGEMMTTDEYNDPAFDYTSQDWYQIAVDTDQDTVYTSPYLDTNVDVTMVTATAPFYNKSDQFMGVVTADINLTDIQELINDIEVEKTGYAFLIDAEGTYIADKDSEKMMDLTINEDPNQSLASLGDQILEGNSQLYEFKDGKGDNSLFIREIEDTGWIVGLAVPNKELYASLSSLTNKQLIISILGIGFIVIVILLYSRWIVRNVNNVKEMAETIASGDLSQELTIKSQDEFGHLANAINQMQENLKNIVKQMTNASHTISNHSRELTESADGVNEGARQVALTMQELATGSESQVNTTGNLASMMDTFSSKVQHTNENGEEIRVSSLDVLEMTNSGRELMDSSNEQMHQIEVMVHDAVEKMDRLDHESQEISKLVTVIQDVAEQTNLLALNAAIEAARAGEHGQGFAVVADEVRKLAEQVAISITDITGFVTNIQTESESVSKSLRDGYTEVEQGATQIQTTGNTFNQISSSVTAMVDKITYIAENLSDIAGSSDEMSHSIENIAMVSESSAAGVEQTSASSQEMSSSMEEVAERVDELTELAGELNELTDQFKL